MGVFLLQPKNENMILPNGLTFDWVKYLNALKIICADVQADLGLHCPHMLEDTFLHDAVHIYLNNRLGILDAEFQQIPFVQYF